MKYFNLNHKSSWEKDANNFKAFKKLHQKSLGFFLNNYQQKYPNIFGLMLKSLKELPSNQLTKILKINPVLIEYFI